jgi:hypothetical protein
MTVAASLRAAISDFYGQSWRMVLLNACVALSLAAVAAATLFVRVAIVLGVLVGPLVTMLMHCCLTLLRTDELHLGNALTGLRTTWRRGLVLGSLVVGALVLGVVAVPFYAGLGVWAWPLAVLTVYLVLMFLVLQLAIWPIAVAFPDRPLLDTIRTAGAVVARRPFRFVALAAALAAVNTLGLLLGLLPFFMLTIAYSFFVSAHFALPQTEPEAEPWRVSPTTT